MPRPDEERRSAHALHDLRDQGVNGLDGGCHLQLSRGGERSDATQTQSAERDRDPGGGEKRLRRWTHEVSEGDWGVQRIL